MGVVRGIFATIGVLLMVITGGCAVLIAVGTHRWLAVPAALVTPTFLAGLAMFLAARYLGRE